MHHFGIKGSPYNCELGRLDVMLASLCNCRHTDWYRPPICRNGDYICICRPIKASGLIVLVCTREVLFPVMPVCTAFHTIEVACVGIF
jgi:hypothetical protein